MTSIQDQKNAKLTAEILAKASGKPVDEVKVVGTKNAITVKGKVYNIEPLGALDGLDTWEYILQKVLPSVGSGLDAMQQEESFGDSTAFSEAMIHLSNKLEGDSFKMLSVTLFQGATVDGIELDINEHFSANYGVWRKVFTHAMKVNFSSFFEEGWSAGLQDLMMMVSPQFSE
jgi:hypothetical protein